MYKTELFERGRDRRLGGRLGQRSPSTADAQRVKWKMHSAWGSSVPHLGTRRRAFLRKHQTHFGRQIHIEVLRAWGVDPGERGFRCRLQGLDRDRLDDRGLRYRQVPGTVVLHCGAVRPDLWRVFRVEEVRRRGRVGGRDLQQAQCAQDRHPRHRPRDFRLVQGRDHGSGAAPRHENAFLRPRRPRHAEDRRVDPAPGRRRHLPGAGEGRHRCHRVLDAGHGHQVRLLPDRQEQLLPGLAPAGLGEPSADQQGQVGRICRTRTKRFSRSPPARASTHIYAETEYKSILTRWSRWARSTA